jgi:hypothetical protein
MFVIVHNGFVTLGPRPWNKLMFEEELRDECGIEYVLETRNNSLASIVIDENTSVLPVVALPQPDYNPKIQRLDGPYWNFHPGYAEMYYTVGELPIEAVKNNLKAQIADTRYKREVEGIVFEGKTIDTMRGSRDIFTQTYLLMGAEDEFNWKFPEGWEPVNKQKLGEIVTAGVTHIQTQFGWEAAKEAEIEAAQTLEELDAITDIEYTPPVRTEE